MKTSNSKRILSIFVLTVIIFNSVSIFAISGIKGKKIQLNRNGIVSNIVVHSGTVKELFELYDVKLSENESVNYNLNDDLTNGMNIVIKQKEATNDKVVEDSDNKTINGKKYTKVIKMQATAYDPTAGPLTALGTKVRVGAVAVDPKVIPLKTKLYIQSTDSFPTYGFAVAEDTGGAIKGNRIDLFYSTPAEARNFGRRDVLVYVLED